MKSVLFLASCLLLSYTVSAVNTAPYGGVVCTDGFCLNGGTCTTIEGSAGFFGTPTISRATCACPTGYKGATCEYQVVYDCLGNEAPDVWVGDTICHNGNIKFGGKFINFNCVAYDFDGGDCATPATANNHGQCTTNPCGAGKCYGSDSKHWCSCPRHTAGGSCSFVADACSTSPCQNGARCITDVTETYNYKCVCASYLNYDKNCSSTYPTGGGSTDYTCADPNCSGHGTCVYTDTCSCNTGYYASGPACLENTQCDSSPCQNGGTCTESKSSNTYTCTCPSGYTGTNCETYIAICHPEPCLHSGLCLSSGIDYWSCDCGTSYRGLNCTYAIGAGFDCASARNSNGYPPAWVSDGSCEHHYTYLSAKTDTVQARYELIGSGCLAGDKDCPSETSSGARFALSVLSLVVLLAYAF